MDTSLRITGGLYLVVDPAPGRDAVLPKAEAALEGGVDVLQIWDHWDDRQDREGFVKDLCNAARLFRVPVLLNDNIELLEQTGAHGIHFDTPELTPEEVTERAGRDVLYGVTCGNDLARVRWAAEQKADYISFCSMYPSPSVDSCDIVSLETVREARQIAAFPIFASGGITPENLIPVLESGADGIAVISGILSAEDPGAAAKEYKTIIETIRNRQEAS